MVFPLIVNYAESNLFGIESILSSETSEYSGQFISRFTCCTGPACRACSDLLAFQGLNYARPEIVYCFATAFIFRFEPSWSCKDHGCVSEKQQPSHPFFSYITVRICRSCAGNPMNWPFKADQLCNEAFRFAAYYSFPY